MEEKYNGWRIQRDHRPPHHGATHKDVREGFHSEDFPVIPATRFFDQLSFIGNEFVGCFVLETPEGLLMIDCMETADAYIDILQQGMKDLGLDEKDVKVLLISHGHADHFGLAGRLQELYGTKLYMSQVDETMAMDPNTPRAPSMPPLSFKMDGYIEGGQTFRFGGVDIKIYSTPGHTPGCLSFIFDVTDEGRPHKVALWGGTGIPRNAPDQDVYLASAKRFVETVREEGVDAEISTHPFVDLSSDRLAVCRHIVNGVPNPFVIGTEAAIRYHEMFVDLCLHRMDNPPVTAKQ